MSKEDQTVEYDPYGIAANIPPDNIVFNYTPLPCGIDYRVAPQLHAMLCNVRNLLMQQKLGQRLHIEKFGEGVQEDAYLTGQIDLISNLIANLKTEQVN